jgi:hypothetical protein
MADRYWVGGTANWDNVAGTKWATTSGGVGGASVPNTADAVFFTNLSTGTCTIATVSANALSVDFTGFIGTLAGTQGITVAGSVRLAPDMTYTYAGTITFTGTGTFTTAGKILQSITFINGAGVTVTLGDRFTSTRDLNLNVGSLNANNQDVSVASFTSSGSTTRTLTMGSGTWTLTGNGPVWSINSVNLTFNVNTANIVLSDTSTLARTFTGSTLTYNTLTIGGPTGTSTLTITAGTFARIASTKTVAHTIQLSGSISVGDWTVTGTPGNVVTVNSSLASAQRIITYTGSGTVSMDYMSIQSINFGYTLGASNPYLVYAGANSTNGGNNAGILFQSTRVKAYRLITGTAWTVPTDWNNSSNTIHMIGGGGGGATGVVSVSNRAAGGSGGGGGYRVLTNQIFTSGASVPYVIGAGGTIGLAGGNTTFNTANTAGGGGAGTASTLPTSSGGAGGTGTFAGGAGSAGTFGTAASTGYGAGGGGGAGGPNGVGGNGGAGLASTTTTRGGGGGGNGGGDNGTNGTTVATGNGGNNFSGVGGGVGASGSGSLGGGGAGAQSGSGGAGGSGIDIANTIGGAGGRGGASGTGAQTNPGEYGGGGSGGPVSVGGLPQVGGAGSQGVIFIIYGVATGNFFLMF